MTSKKDLSEQDICTQFILPAIQNAGWDIARQVRQEVSFTNGQIFVKGNKTFRGPRKRADFILYIKPNIPVAVIEAKDNTQTPDAGLQQALDYAHTLDVPVAFSSNGDSFIQHDGSGLSLPLEKELTLDSFPSPDQVWAMYKKYKKLETPAQEAIAPTIITLIVPAVRPVIISRLPLIRLSKPWRRVKIVSFWSWLPVPARPMSLSRSFTGSGKMAPGRGSCFWPTVMC
jgi:type I site-specific restriction endonuclease